MSMSAAYLYSIEKFKSPSPFTIYIYMYCAIQIFITIYIFIRDSNSFGKGISSRCVSVETPNRSLTGLESGTNKPVDEHDIKCGDGSPNQLDQIDGLEAARCQNGEEIDVGKFDMHPDDKIREICPFVGFQTAKGDKVTVSKEMLAKVKDLFDNNEDDVNDTGCLNQDQHLQNVTDPAAFTGFQTARGTKVDVSKTALLKAQRLLDEETSYQFKDDAQESHDNCGAIELQISNGNAVTASKKSLESPSGKLHCYLNVVHYLSNCSTHICIDISHTIL